MRLTPEELRRRDDALAFERRLRNHNSPPPILYLAALLLLTAFLAWIYGWPHHAPSLPVVPTPRH